MTNKRHDKLTILEQSLGADNSLAGTRPDIADEIQVGDELLAELALLADPVEPPEGLLQSIEGAIDALPQQGADTVRAEEGEWQKRSDKIWQKTLRSDPKTGSSIYMLRCEPGAIIPPHRHKHNESVFVIEGEFRIDNTIVKAGDHQFSPAGNWHGMITSPTGCLVLIHA